MDNKPDPKKGEDFMRAIVKASLYGLFAIGVRSQKNIDDFIVAFTSKVESELTKLGMIPAVKKDLPGPPKTISQSIQAISTTSSHPVPITPFNSNHPNTSGIEVLKLHHFIIKNLKKANINTVEQLIGEMQKRPLTEIKGIKNKAQDRIREAVKNYTK